MTPRHPRIPTLAILSRAAAIGAAVAALSSCAKSTNNLPLFEAHGPVEVGATQFAVTSVTPWSQIQRDLQPNFPMDEQLALEEVMPSTLYSTEQTNNSMQVGISAGYSMGASGPSAATSKSKPAAATPPPSSAKSGTTPPSSAKGSGADKPDSHSDDSHSPDGIDTPPALRSPTLITQQSQAVSGPLGMEPQLKYSLATSLLQYVRLTNHYVQDLVNHDQCDAYVVRVQVSLMPLTRTAQYDTYVDIGFFDEATATSDGSPQTAIKSLEVVPLLSTDSLEGVMRSQSSNDLHELALTLQASFNGAGGGFNADKLSQILKQVSGRDVNSLVTMGRVSDNTLRVRLGAQAEPTGQFVMVPRTYTVPVILMVRRSPSAARQTTIRAVSKTVFINAITGQLLAGRTHLGNVAALPEIRETYNLFKLGLSSDDLMKLTEFAILDDVQGFTKMVQGSGKHLTTAEIGRLWLEALSLRATDAVQKLTFSLPITPQPMIPPTDQTATLFDDGNKTVISLNGGQALSRLLLQGILEINTEQGQKMRLYALDDPTISNNEQALAFTFPSLTAAGMTLAVGNIDPARLTLCVQTLPDPTTAAPSDIPTQTRWNVVRLSTAPALPTPTLPPVSTNLDPADANQPIVSLEESQIELDNTLAGTATANIVVPTNYAGDAEFSVIGAELDPQSLTAASPIQFDNGKWLIKRGGTVALHLTKFSQPSLEFRVIDRNGHWRGVTRPVAGATPGIKPAANPSTTQPAAHAPSQTGSKSPSNEGSAGRRTTPGAAHP